MTWGRTEALAARGIGLLAISYRGYPGSTGSPSEDGLLTDGIAAFDWLAPRVKGGIVVLGRSLGTYLILDHIERARKMGLPHVYLGYWVRGSAKMDYKRRFLPQERLLPDGWQRVDA